MRADQASILADLTAMTRAILGEFADDQELTRDTAFRADLGMESIDVVALAGRLQARYGNAVNFAQFVARLELEEVRDLTVGRLVDYISTSLAAKPGPERGPDDPQAGPAQPVDDGRLVNVRAAES